MKHIIFIILGILLLTSCGNSEVTQTETGDDGTKIVTTDTAGTVEKLEVEAEEEKEVIIPPAAPSFSDLDIDFDHSFDTSAFSFLGGTFIDIDSDGLNEVFITGGKGQSDGFFTYNNGKLEDIISSTNINNAAAGYGSYAIDFDADGDEDLFVTRHDGVYYYDNIGGKFTEKKLDIVFPDRAAPLDIDFGDIDDDGDLDVYVSTFVDPKFFKAAVFNDSNRVQKNLLLQNDGELKFTDITEDSGLSVVQNTFAGNFADLDSDGDLDIVISPNTDSVKIFENNGGKFTQAFESDIYGFWMGLAMTDVDSDGDLDLFFSNVGTSIPQRAVQGDSTGSQNVVTQYLLLENLGGMKFQEKKDPAFDKLGFGWGIVPVDFNLDAKDDYLVMQNYIKWPPHKLKKLPGELLVQGTDGGFIASIDDYGLENKAYGISALVGDINGDNFDDVFYLNLDGDQKVHLRDTDVNNRFLKIKLPNTSKYLHATVEIFLNDGMNIKKVFIPKQGLLTKQDSSMIFGLNATIASPQRVTITLKAGESNSFDIEKGQRVLEVN